MYEIMYLLARFCKWVCVCVDGYGVDAALLLSLIIVAILSVQVVGLGYLSLCSIPIFQGNGMWRADRWMDGWGCLGGCLRFVEIHFRNWHIAIPLFHFVFSVSKKHARTHTSKHTRKHVLAIKWIHLNNFQLNSLRAQYSCCLWVCAFRRLKLLAQSSRQQQQQQQSES